MKKKTKNGLVYFRYYWVVRLCYLLVGTGGYGFYRIGKKQDLKDAKIESIPATDKKKSPEKANQRKDTFITAISKPGSFPSIFPREWLGWKCNVCNFASLVTTDKQSKPIPDLAEKWDISADQLTYTFHLRKI